jgi:CHC2-type zinc finger protein
LAVEPSFPCVRWKLSYGLTNLRRLQSQAVTAMHAEARQIAALVPMGVLLGALGFIVNKRTRRCACLIHGGSNPTAFAWTDAGLWKCHSCGAGGDRIALVRAVRQCSFRDSVELLAALVGVEYHPAKLSGAEVERVRDRHERAERAAWRIRDEILRLRIYYCDVLHRSERLWRRIGGDFPGVRNETEREAVWLRLARLAPAATYFLAAHDFLNRADAATLARFALASTADRRTQIFGEINGNANLQAA